MTSVVNLYQLPAERALTPPDMENVMDYVILSTRDFLLFGNVDCVLRKPPRLLGPPRNDSTQNFRPARLSKSRTFLLKLPKKRQFSGIRKLF